MVLVERFAPDRSPAGCWPDGVDMGRSMLPERLLAIDFEASCLPSAGRSYPIELGLSDTDGNARSWLIRPAPEWRDWHWCAEAEALHGISREQLEAEGLPAAEVMQALLGEIDGAWLMADSYLDAEWLRTLAEAGGMVASPSVGHIVSLMDVLETTRADVATAEARLAAYAFRRHRARDDARRLALLAGGLMDAAARTGRGMPRQFPYAA